MKAIINNKLYDTDKAEEIYSFIKTKQGQEVIFKPGYYYQDKCECAFYKTAKGAYFECDSTRKEITEVTIDYVMEVVRKCNVDRYIELFGEVEEA